LHLDFGANAVPHDRCPSSGRDSVGRGTKCGAAHGSSARLGNDDANAAIDNRAALARLLLKTAEHRAQACATAALLLVRRHRAQPPFSMTNLLQELTS